jgi:ribosomal-protein-alanine N-acetyltransferase
MAIQLETDRLRLVAPSPAVIRAEIDDRVEMARLLGATVPPSWPPPLFHVQAMRYFLELVERHPEDSGFGCWYWLRKAKAGRADLVIGNGGFKKPPSTDGVVEMGYSVVSEHQNQGYATESVGALLAWAFHDPRVRKVVAETEPDGVASQRVLLKCGFVRSEEPPGTPGSLRFAILRS